MKNLKVSDWFHYAIVIIVTPVVWVAPIYLLLAAFAYAMIFVERFFDYMSQDKSDKKEIGEVKKAPLTFVLGIAFLFLMASILGLFVVFLDRKIPYEKAVTVSLAIVLIIAIAGSIVSYRKCGNIFFCSGTIEDVK